jgi:DNA polymerase-3 subunit delta
LNKKAGREKAAHDPAVLIISEEPYLLKERENQIRDSLVPPESRDLNFLVLYGWEADAADVVEFLQTMPFLADCRLLILREVHAMKENKPVMEYLKNPNPASCLVMTSSEMKKKDSRFRAISALAQSSELRKPHGRAMVKWVEDRFAKSGKSIEPSLAEILVQITGNDMTILVSEIEKVVISSGEKRLITQDDLSVSVPGGVEAVFSLLDAVGDGDRTRAMSALKKLLENDNPPEYLIHMLAWHYRQMLRGMDLVASGLNASQAAEKMGKRYGLKDKFARHLGRATGKELVRAVKDLSSYDLELKRGKIPSEVLLDRLILDLIL